MITNTSSIITEKQMEEWVNAGVRIKTHFGINKGLGYLIGEKFYEVVKMIYSAWEIMRTIDQEREKPDYNPVRKTGSGQTEHTFNFDEIYEAEKKKIPEIKKILEVFSSHIKKRFSQNEINEYFDSHPRLGKLGHILTEEEHQYLVNHEAVKHSIDTEVMDAKIFGDMIKYL